MSNSGKRPKWKQRWKKGYRQFWNQCLNNVKRCKKRRILPFSSSKTISALECGKPVFGKRRVSETFSAVRLQDIKLVRWWWFVVKTSTKVRATGSKRRTAMDIGSSWWRRVINSDYFSLISKISLYFNWLDGHFGVDQEQTSVFDAIEFFLFFNQQISVSYLSFPGLSFLLNLR